MSPKRPPINAGATTATQAEVLAAYKALGGLQVRTSAQPDGTVLVRVYGANDNTEVGGAHSRNGEAHAYALAARAARVLCKVHDAGGEGWVGKRPETIFTKARRRK